MSSKDICSKTGLLHPPFFFKGAIIERKTLCRWGRRLRRHRDKEKKDQYGGAAAEESWKWESLSKPSREQTGCVLRPPACTVCVRGYKQGLLGFTTAFPGKLRRKGGRRPQHMWRTGRKAVVLGSTGRGCFAGGRGS